VDIKTQRLNYQVRVKRQTRIKYNITNPICSAKKKKKQEDTEILSIGFQREKMSI